VTGLLALLGLVAAVLVSALAIPLGSVETTERNAVCDLLPFFSATEITGAPVSTSHRALALLLLPAGSEWLTSNVCQPCERAVRRTGLVQLVAGLWSTEQANFGSVGAANVSRAEVSFVACPVTPLKNDGATPLRNTGGKGGFVSTTQFATVDAGPVFPASSFCLTVNKCGPSRSPVISLGDEHGTKAPRSKEQVNVAPGSPEYEIEADADRDNEGGLVPTNGADGGVKSISHETDVESLVAPVPSLCRTDRECTPSLRLLNVIGDIQAVATAPSTSHVNPAPESPPNAIVMELVFALVGTFDEIVGANGPSPAILTGIELFDP